MKRTSKIIGGIALLAFGIVWALELLGVISISLDGWWALFVIVPCFVNIFSDRHKAGAIIGCGIGVRPRHHPVERHLEVYAMPRRRRVGRVAAILQQEKLRPLPQR